MRKFLLILGVFIIGCTNVFAAIIPAEVRSYIQEKIPQADIRFDGVIIFPDNTIYLPLYPSLFSDITELKIKETYPDFKRSYPYPAFDKIVKKSDAKYLLKYDRVIVKTTFFGKTKEYSIKNIDEDFPELSQEIRTYIKIKSGQRALKRISSRLNRLDAYYKRPTELFARFVEGLFIDTNKISEIAPYTYLVFCKELACNRYLELADFINKFF